MTTTLTIDLGKSYAFEFPPMVNNKGIASGERVTDAENCGAEYRRVLRLSTVSLQG